MDEKYWSCFISWPLWSSTFGRVLLTPEGHTWPSLISRFIGFNFIWRNMYYEIQIIFEYLKSKYFMSGQPLLEFHLQLVSGPEMFCIGFAEEIKWMKKNDVPSRSFACFPQRKPQVINISQILQLSFLKDWLSRPTKILNSSCCSCLISCLTKIWIQLVFLTCSYGFARLTIQCIVFRKKRRKAFLLFRFWM